MLIGRLYAASNGNPATGTRFRVTASRSTSWAVGFALRWLVQEIERRGVRQDRLLFASDEPWGDHSGELARLQAAAGDGELGRMVLRDNFTTLYG